MNIDIHTLALALSLTCLLQVIVLFVQYRLKQRLLAESREAKEHYELIFNTSPDAVVITRQHDGTIVHVNNGFISLTGYSRAEVLGKSTLNLNIWKTPEDRTNFIDKLKVNGFCENLEAVFQRKDGSQLIGILSAKVFQLHGVPHLIGVTRDITDRKRTEDALRETQDLFSSFMRYSPIYVFIKEVTPTESRVLQASDNFAQMIGISGRDMMGKTMSDLFPAEFAAKISADDWNVVAKGEVLKLEENLHGRDYTTIKFPLVQGDKTLVAGYTIAITDHKCLQEKLLQQATTDELTGITNPVVSWSWRTPR